jgi:hypothetical protein
VRSHDVPDGQRVSDEQPSAPQELPLLIGGGKGAPETLMLIGAPRHGRVTVRRWSSDDWSAAPLPAMEEVADLLQWIERQAAAGRTLNQSLYGVRLWLRGEGIAPPSR